jgi:hypothetical protein
LYQFVDRNESHKVIRNSIGMSLIKLYETRPNGILLLVLLLIFNWRDRLEACQIPFDLSIFSSFLPAFRLPPFPTKEVSPWF